MDFSKITEAEFTLLMQASEDFGRFGKTQRICSRCSNSFEFFQNGSSYQIKCKTDNCLDIVGRGI
ncbi:MAG: hypothetical protein FWG63_00505 [Defluviitaleaceae bacterium]|nr:hypothetical protein [Defluviitaleaceae bacterium]